MANDEHTAADTVRLASQLRAWLDRIGAAETGAAVDFADIIAAGWEVETLVRHLLTLDPQNPADADEAASVLGKLHAWLIVEMRWHLYCLKKNWGTIEDRLSVFMPPDEDNLDDEDDEPSAP